MKTAPVEFLPAPYTGCHPECSTHFARNEGSRIEIAFRRGESERISPRALLMLFVAALFLSFNLRAFSAKPPARAHLLPHFAAGQVFRYSVQTRIESTTSPSGVIVDPEGPKKLVQSVNAVIRLEILTASQNPSERSARVRVTYEKIIATSNGPAYDPDVIAIRDQYQKLSGQSFEFTLGADGKIGDVKGFDKIPSDPSRASVLNQWLAQLTFGAALPKQGIAVGEKWSSTQPLENIPLDGLAWRTRATYVRDEPCPVSAQSAAPTGKPLTPAPDASNICAVILTRSTITGGEHSKDRTPAVFRQNGLRTSGIWTGAAEALIAISLRTGMVASVTQTGSTHMDFTIMTTLERNRMRYAGDTRTQSNITLLSQSAVP